MYRVTRINKWFTIVIRVCMCYIPSSRHWFYLICSNVIFANLVLASAISRARFPICTCPKVTFVYLFFLSMEWVCATISKSAYAYTCIRLTTFCLSLSLCDLKRVYHPFTLIIIGQWTSFFSKAHDALVDIRLNFMWVTIVFIVTKRQLE